MIRKPFGIGVWRKGMPLVKSEWVYEGRRDNMTAYVNKLNENLYLVKKANSWEVIDMGIGASSLVTAILSKHKVMDSGRKLKWVM